MLSSPAAFGRAWPQKVFKSSQLIDSEKPMELSRPIELPLTRDSVIRVLTYGANPEASPYSHKQIAEWCDRF
ncbi:hypothetical protein MasN3_12500 [Massilia varians]|uniref:Uncharacterized protein n=1 Tax=Massilia varians TaxID=457921 RepID=A0ABM8C3M1_9BURK|nr:hypothetical protein MasN3_12500 [Massilia varians]